MTNKEAVRQQKDLQRKGQLSTNLDRRDRAFKIEGLPETKMTSQLMRTSGRRQKGQGR